MNGDSGGSRTHYPRLLSPLSHVLPQWAGFTVASSTSATESVRAETVNPLRHAPDAGSLPF